MQVSFNLEDTVKLGKLQQNREIFYRLCACMSIGNQQVKMEKGYTSSDTLRLLLYIPLLVFIFHPKFINGETHYIKPSRSSFCPSKKHCLTLMQFALGTHYYNGGNVSLKLLPGNHNLDVELVTNNACNFSLHTAESDAYSYQESAVIVNCSSSAWFKFSVCDHVEISHVQFNGCAGNKVESVSDFTVTFSFFMGLNGSGSALVLNNTSKVKIIHCYFISNTGGTNISSISFSDFEKFGGAIDATFCNIWIAESFFLRNKQAKLIRFNKQTNITIKNSHFEQNRLGCFILAESYSMISVNNSNFSRNSIIFSGFCLLRSTIKLVWSSYSFSHNDVEGIGTGGAIFAKESKITLENSIISHVNGSFYGGTIYCLAGTIKISETIFDYNTAEDYGGVLYTVNTDVTIKHSLFQFNSASLGGVLSLFWGTTITINGSIFSNNRVNDMVDTVGDASGGAIFASVATLHISNTIFRNNKAGSGGAISMYDTNITFLTTAFYNNTAASKGVIFANNSTIMGYNLEFQDNVGSWSVLYLVESVAEFSVLNFHFNMGSILAIRSRLKFSIYCTFSKNKPQNLTALSYQGGAITSFQSTFNIHGQSYFTENCETHGGAIYAFKSALNFHDDVLISGNNAANKGGGIYLYQSDIQCYNNCTVVQNNAIEGGGIYTVSGSINVVETDRSISANIHIQGNVAKYGGGVYISSNAKLYYSHVDDVFEVIKFRGNYAMYGGALYVADDTNFGTCHSLSNADYATTSECFFQNIYFEASYFENPHITYQHGFFQFHNNTAQYAGSNLFGGLLDRCSVNPFSSPLQNAIKTEHNLFLKYLSQYIDLNSVSSHPVRLCFCINDQPNCSYRAPTKYVKKGEEFKLSLVAVDQVNHPINATIHCSLSSSKAGLGEAQLSQTTFQDCTYLNFKIFSPFETENLVMYAEGPCRDAGLSQTNVQISFLPCICPVGFQQSMREKSSCVCECHHILKKYAIICNASTQSLMREEDYWISYINNSDNQSGFIFHLHCPYDYCLPSTPTVSINFNIPIGADAQCAFGRSGTLCGTCQPNLSLSLGSSRCIRCPTKWPTVTVFIIVGSAFAGVLLVAIILMLNLTVAVGTINGFIFYANVIAANSRTYLPFTKPNYCTIFIAWFNLELGFDACFFEGMDAYVKTWLQLAFPMYVIIMVVTIIFVSRHSTRFSQIIGKRNPVATLATLILLAFAKFLRTTITIFSFAILEYPDKTKEVLWLPDASIKYLNAKHVPLFLIASLIVVVGLIYILLLLSWQWLLKAPNANIFRWTRSNRVRLFMDAHLAPHTYRCRFWTGLLLFVRVILHLVSAADVSGDPMLHLLAVSLVMTCLLLLKALLRDKIYKKLPTELLEIACYFNLLLFTIVSFFSQGIHERQRRVAHIFVGLILTLFLCILFYHILRIACEIRYAKQLKVLGMHKILKRNAYKIATINVPDDTEMQGARIVALPTTSIVEMRSCLSAQHDSESPLHKAEQKYKQVAKQSNTKGNDQKNQSVESDALANLREPLLQQ